MVTSGPSLFINPHRRRPILRNRPKGRARILRGHQSHGKYRRLKNDGRSPRVSRSGGYETKTRGIELLRDGDRLNEHCQRFAVGGKYARWIEGGWTKDWVVLDCRTTYPAQPYGTFACVFQTCTANSKLGGRAAKLLEGGICRRSLVGCNIGRVKWGCRPAVCSEGMNG